MFTVTKAGRASGGRVERNWGYAAGNLAYVCRCRPRTDQNQSNLFCFLYSIPSRGTEHVLVVSKPLYKKTTHAACSANKQRTLERASEDERGKGTVAPQPTCSNARTSQHDGGGVALGCCLRGCGSMRVSAITRIIKLHFMGFHWYLYTETQDELIMGLWLSPEPKDPTVLANQELERGRVCLRGGDSPVVR